MRHGLLGAQRTGKTTLAKAYAEQHGLPFVATNTRQVLASLAMDAKTQYPIRQRLFAQNAILAELCRQWTENDNCLFDRTPLDVLAYMEADVLRDFPNDEETVEAYMSYRARCFTALNLFDTLMLVQPGIKIVEDVEAAQGSIPYMEHFNTLCLGYLHEARLTGITTLVLDRQITDLQQRVSKLYCLVS